MFGTSSLGDVNLLTKDLKKKHLGHLPGSPAFVVNVLKKHRGSLFGGSSCVVLLQYCMADFVSEKW